MQLISSLPAIIDKTLQIADPDSNEQRPFLLQQCEKKESGIRVFHLYAGGRMVRILTDGPGFLTLANLLATAERWITKILELKGIEQSEAADLIGKKIADEIVTSKSVIRSDYLFPMRYDDPKVKQRKRQSLSELILSMANDLDQYMSIQNKKLAPVVNHAMDTMRLRTVSDSILHPDPLLKLVGANLLREDISSGIRNRAEETVFQDFSGFEFLAFMTISRLWYTNGKPERLNIDRGKFLSEMGFQITGGALYNLMNKIRDFLYSWSKPDPYKILAPVPTENGNVDFTLDVRLPVLREHKAEVKGSAKKIVWTFSDFDIALFPPEPLHGYRKVAARPFRLIASRLGNTNSSEKALHAASIILCEISYGRTRPFEIGLDTLKLKTEDFARHAEYREQAIGALRDALATVNIFIEVSAKNLKVTPAKELAL